MSRKKESLPPVSSQETEEKEIRKKSRVKEPPHQTNEPETNKVDLQDLDADTNSSTKKTKASRKKKQNVVQDSSLECLKDTEPVSPETTKPKRKRRTKAEMEAAKKELEKEIGEKTSEKDTEEPEKKKRRRKKEDVTAVPKEISSESVSEEVNSKPNNKSKRKDTKKKITPKEVENKEVPSETSKESEHTEPNPKPEHKESKKKANQKEMSNESMRNEEQNKVVPTEVQTKEKTQTANKPAKRPKKSRKKELIYAVCLKNGGEMVVEEAGEKTRKKYEGAMYELMISDTLAVLKKSEVPSARIKPMEEDMYYEINDDLYHVEFYRNGRRIG